MTQCLVILTLLMSVAVTPAAAQNLLVLKVKDVGATADGRVTVILTSGATLTIPLVDIDFDQSRSLLERGSAQTQTASVPTMSLNELLFSPSGADAAIRSTCQGQWGTNFQMRAFCERQQNAALATLRSRNMSGGDRSSIRQLCTDQWQTNFQMVNFCEEQQLKALDELRR